MFSPLPVAGCRSRVRFTSAAAAHDSEGEETEESPLPSLVRKLKFTQQSCITPGRYAARHQLSEPLRVVLRLRPCDSASDDTAHQSMEVVDDNTVLLRAPVGSQAFKNGERESRYTFSSVLDENCSQEKLYRSSAAPLVESLVDGHNGLIFAYGITNSGKTHSIRGSEARPGILFRSIDHLFQKLEQQQTPFAVWLSYLEIYNDKLYDLLSDDVPLSKRKALRLVANKKGQVYVNGLREVLVDCGQEARAAVAQGERNRQVAETVLNADSSRSHCVFSLKLVEKGNDKDLDGTWSKLCIVDLAGAERSSRTNASKGERFREASKINTSLMQLGRCLDAVRWNQAHPDQRARVVPFRDSKTTRLFKDFFSGWGRTTMIATANPSSTDHDETAHALRFAALAREVRCVSKVNTGLGSKQAPSNGTETSGSEKSAEPEEEAAPQAMEIDQQQEQQQEQEQEPSDNDEESLLDQIFELKKRLVASERARADIEQHIRGELSEEMTAHLQSQETLYRTQLDQQCARTQRLAEKKLELWKKRVLSECGGGVDESLLLMDVRSQAQREIHDANEEVRAANTRLQEAANDAQQRIDSANQQKNEARETLREAQLERMELVSKLREKRTDHELMRKRIEELSELCEERKHALQEARTIADKQQSGVAALEAGALSHAEERTALQQRLHEEREKVAQLQLTIDTQQSQLMEAGAQSSDLEQKLHDHQRQLEDRATDTLQMQRRLETEGTTLLETQQQLEAETTQKRQLEARFAEAEQAQDKLQQQLVEAQKLVQNANSTCNDLGQSLAARDRSIAELHDTVNEQQSKLQKLLQEQAERDAEQQRQQQLLHHQAEEQRHQMQLLQTRLQEQEQEHERRLREKAQELQELQEQLNLGGIDAQQHEPIPFSDDAPMEPEQEPIAFVDDAPMVPEQELLPFVDDAPMVPEQQKEQEEEEEEAASVPVEAEVPAPAVRASRSRKRPQRARAPARSRRSTRSKKPIDNIVLTEDESDVAPVAASVSENTSSRSSGSRRALRQKQPQSEPEAKPEAEMKLGKAVVQVDKTQLRAPIRLTAADKENIQRQTTKRKTRARTQQPTYLKRKVEKRLKADEWASLFEDPFAKPSSEEEPEPSPKRVRTNEPADVDARQQQQQQRLESTSPPAAEEEAAAAAPSTRARSPRRTRRRRRQP